jgi:DNA repair protein RecN (Recombination protein N)
VTASGANRQFVNGSPATLSALSTIGQWLVDIHGPHDHQSLLHSASQLAMLDAFGRLEAEREAFGVLVRQRSELIAQKAALVLDEAAYARQLDLLRFQVNEITAARLEPEEDLRVELEHQRASNAARLLQLSQEMLAILTENDGSTLAQSGIIGRRLSELHRLDPGCSSLLTLHEQAAGALQELQSELTRYVDKIDLDADRLKELEERLNLVQSLKRKYGGSLAAVLEFGETARLKLAGLEQRDAELARLNTELEQVETGMQRLGRDLSAKRSKAIPELSKAVSRELRDLGFKQSRFDVAIAGESQISNFKSQIPASGLDTVEFQFAPNPGEPARALRAIASSGELARVMLALKTVLAAEDEIPVLIFDEVDANVGGETANAIGEKMRRIAARRQVLCITHLPQVAATASAHYVVTKQVQKGRTVSEIALLDKSARVVELTRMLGGQTEAARKHAESLLSSPL